VKRKATLDAHIQAAARTTFHRLRLEINQLDRNRQQLRQGLDDYTQPQSGLMCSGGPSQAPAS
jgi:hypothetical protein